MVDLEKQYYLPVHKARKFSTVLGTTSPNKPSTMRPRGSPPTSTSKKHLVVTLACSSSSNELLMTQQRRALLLLWDLPEEEKESAFRLRGLCECKDTIEFEGEAMALALPLKLGKVGIDTPESAEEAMVGVGVDRIFSSKITR